MKLTVTVLNGKDKINPNVNLVPTLVLMTVLQVLLLDTKFVLLVNLDFI